MTRTFKILAVASLGAIPLTALAPVGLRLVQPAFAGDVSPDKGDHADKADVGHDKGDAGHDKSGSADHRGK